LYSNINAAGLNFCGNCGYSLAPSTPVDEQQKMEDKTSGSTTSGGFCSRFQSWSLKSIVGFAVLANVVVILGTMPPVLASSATNHCQI